MGLCLHNDDLVRVVYVWLADSWAQIQYKYVILPAQEIPLWR